MNYELAIKLIAINNATANINATSSAVTRLEGAAKKAGGSTATLSQSMMSAGSQINVMGQRLTWMVSVPLLMFANKAIDTAVEVNKAWNSFHNSFSGTDDDFKNLQKTAIEFSNKFGTSQENVAQSMKTFYLAGITDKTILESLTNTALTTSKTFEIDLSDATKMAQQAYFSFHQTADEVAMSMATLDAIATQTTGTTQDVAVMLTNAGAAASLTGFSMEDLASASAVFSAAGFAAGKAGNAMRTILLYVNDGARSASAHLSDFGINIKDVAWNTGTAEDKLKLLAQAYEKVEKSGSIANKNAFAESAKTLFGVQQSGPAIKLLQDMALEYDNLDSSQSQYFKGQEIGADKTAVLKFEQEKLKKALESSSNKLEIQNQLYRNAQTIIGNELLPVKLKLLETITKLLEKFNGLSDGTQKWLLIAGGVAIIAGPLLSLIGVFTSLFGFIIAMGAPVIIAIGLIGGAAYLLYLAWTTNFGGIQQKTVEVFASIVTFYNEYLVPLWNKIMTDNAWVIALWKQGWGDAKVYFAAVWGLISSIFSTAWTVLSGLIKIAILLFLGDWSKAWDVFKKTCSDAWESTKQSWKSLWDVMQSAAKGAIDGIIGMVSNLISKLKDLFNMQSKTKTSGGGGGGWNNGGIIPQFNNGGVVYAANGFLSKGRDTIPAMLSPGEMVLNKSQQSTMFDMLSGRTQAQTAGGINVSINVGNMIASRGEQRAFARQIEELLNENLNRK